MAGETTGDRGRLPNLLIAGVSRSGTTSMFHYLGQHSDVGTSDVKELRYFMPLRYGEPLAPVDTYTGHFARCLGERYALEATPGYFYGGRALARGIREVCPPDTRVVVSLRSPIERCWSWFGFVKSRMRIPQELTFEDYVDRCHELHRAGTDGDIENQAFWGLGGGCYARWLDDWTDEFGDRFRLVFFEELASDPRSVVHDLCDWLDLDTDQVQGFAFEVDNKTTQYRHKRLQEIAVGINRRAEPFFHDHRRTKRLLRRGYYLVNRRRPEPGMTPAVRERLGEFYRPYDERLAEQLSRLGLRFPDSWITAGSAHPVSD